MIETLLLTAIGFASGFVVAWLVFPREGELLEWYEEGWRDGSMDAHCYPPPEMASKPGGMIRIPAPRGSDGVWIDSVESFKPDTED